MQKTAYEVRISDWSSDVCASDLIRIPIFVNGDVDSVEKAAAWRMEYEVDGIMIGRASIGYPWIFREIKHVYQTGEYLPGPTIAEREIGRASCRERAWPYV